MHNVMVIYLCNTTHKPCMSSGFLSVVVCMLAPGKTNCHPHARVAAYRQMNQCRTGSNVTPPIYRFTCHSPTHIIRSVILDLKWIHTHEKWRLMDDFLLDQIRCHVSSFWVWHLCPIRGYQVEVTRSSFKARLHTMAAMLLSPHLRPPTKY